MISLLTDMKKSNQDYEFYPTTNEIISKVIADLKSYENGYHRNTHFSSFLDIGAGNGKVLTSIEKEFGHVELYAIEKSTKLLELLNKSFYIIGTDFYEQSLLDKNIDVTFCNPPYSAFEEWAKKIIRETSSNRIYLVIPTRWKDSPDINEAIKYRDAKLKVLGEYTFENAEDRTARAVVNLVRIDLNDDKENAFDLFFQQEFKNLLDKYPAIDDEYQDKKAEEEKNESKFNALVLGEGYIKSLVEMYKADINNIRRNYELVGQLDANLLKEFSISPKKVKELLRERLKGLKNLYWNELLSRMSEITNRLISKKRQQIFDKVHKNGHVDFTEGNIYAVVLWILKNAELYIDEQLLEVYEEMISKANCRNYKSNQKVFEFNRWRYNDENPSHFFLDYRLIIQRWGSLEYSHGTNGHRLTEHASEQIKDILTVAHNLGFSCNTSDPRLYRWTNYNTWVPGKPHTFSCIYKGKPEILLEVKAHLNGNLHIRMNQKFSLALNVEFGRLKGWLHSGAQATEELNETAAMQYFKSNFTALKSPFLSLTDQTQAIQTCEITTEQTTLFSKEKEAV